MRLSLTITVLFRSIAKTILVALLLGAVSFALFSQVVEHIIMEREINTAASLYRGVGAVELEPPTDFTPDFPIYINADPRMEQQYPDDRRDFYASRVRYQPISYAQIDAIAGLQYISSTHTRYMTAGVSDAYYRLDDGSFYYNYTARLVIEATLTEIIYGDTPADPMIMEINTNFNRLLLSDIKILAGNSPFIAGRDSITVYSDPVKYDTYGVPPDIPYTNSGGLFGISARPTIWWTSEYKYDTGNIASLPLGSRYVFVLRFEPLDERCEYIYLSDHLANPWCEAVRLIEGEPDDYLENEEFEPLKTLIEITDADTHTFDVVYTDDMDAIMRFAEGNMAIVDGRALIDEDSDNGSMVCVISREIASSYGLKVSDSIALNLGTELFEQYKGLGAVAAVRDRYEPKGKAVELEIVGIYSDADWALAQKDNPNWNYSISTVFVPKSLLETDESTLSDHVFSPAEFSFTVGNAWDIPAFLEDTAPVIEQMGFRLIFNDGGWPGVMDAFKESERLSTIYIAIFALASAAAIAFAVYLFIVRKKKEYAIMRALGATRRISAKTLIFPLMAVGIVSALAGNCAAWIYTAATISSNDTLAELKGYAVNASVPAGIAVGCVFGQLLMTLLFSYILLIRIGSLSPLALMHTGNK